MILCKYCRSDRLVKRRKEPHIGIYCVACGKWQQWVSPGSPKEREVPWELTGKSLKQLVVDDLIPEAAIMDDAADAVDYAKALPPGVVKLLTHSFFGVTAMSEEEFKAVIEARFPTKEKPVIAHTDITTLNSLYGTTPKKPEDEDDTPPWKED